MPNTQQPNYYTLARFDNTMPEGICELILKWHEYQKSESATTTNFWKKFILVDISKCNDVFLLDMTELLMLIPFVSGEATVDITGRDAEGQIVTRETVTIKPYVEGMLNALFYDWTPEETFALFNQTITNSRFKEMFGTEYKLLFPLLASQQWELMKSICIKLYNTSSNKDFESLILHQNEQARNMLHCFAALGSKYCNNAVQIGECADVLAMLANISPESSSPETDYQSSLLAKLVQQTDNENRASPLHYIFYYDYYINSSLEDMLILANTGFGVAIMKAFEEETRSEFTIQDNKDLSPYDLLKEILAKIQGMINTNDDVPQDSLVKSRLPNLHDLLRHYHACEEANVQSDSGDEESGNDNRYSSRR